MPRFALEAITFGGMILVALYLMSKSGTFINAVPILALYAFAGYRLLPALQRIYNDIIRIRFTIPALDSIYKDLKSLKPYSLTNNKETLPLKEKNSIKKYLL